MLNTDDHGLYIVGFQFSRETVEPDFYVLTLCDSDLVDKDTPLLDMNGRILYTSNQSKLKAMLEMAPEPFASLKVPEELHGIYDIPLCFDILFDPNGQDREQELMDFLSILLDMAPAVDPLFPAETDQIVGDMFSHLFETLCVSGFEEAKGHTMDELLSALAYTAFTIARNLKRV